MPPTSSRPLALGISNYNLHKNSKVTYDGGTAVFADKEGQKTALVVLRDQRGRIEEVFETDIEKISLQKMSVDERRSRLGEVLISKRIKPVATPSYLSIPIGQDHAMPFNEKDDTKTDWAAGLFETIRKSTAGYTKPKPMDLEF